MKYYSGMLRIISKINAIAFTLFFATTISATTLCGSTKKMQHTIDPDNFNVLMSYSGELEGTITYDSKELTILRDGVNRVVYGFSSSGDKITWTVEVLEKGDYRVAVQYTGKMFLNDHAQPIGASYDKIQRWDPECSVSVSSGKHELSAELQRLTLYNEPTKVAGRRQWLEGLLPLKKGTNIISLHLPEISSHQVEAAEKELEEGSLNKSTISLGIRSIELVRPEVWNAMKKRADAWKSDTQWMIDGKYGLFIHWSLLTYPLYGDRMAHETFEWGVNTFDVEAFADMVEETGASWVFFTTCHGRQMFPAPIKTLENLVPGSTTERDLIGELADALNSRDIKLLLYYNFSLGNSPFGRAVGIMDNDYDKWFKYLIDFTMEVSTRYGKKIAGWGYIDSSVPGYERNISWEEYGRALKAGNPDAVVGISSHWWGEFSPFNDLQTTDAGAGTILPLNPELYAEGGRYEGLQQHWSFVLDGSWIPREPYNGVIRSNLRMKEGPRRSTEEYIEYFRAMDEADVPITVNIMITQDVTRKQPFVNPKSLELMRKINMELKE